MKSLLIILIVSQLLGCAKASESNIQSCSSELAFIAEKELSNINSLNWSSLYLLYSKYKICDDGSIAEGFSNAVVSHLGNIPVETSIMEETPQFADFVLNHVGKNMSVTEYQQILTNISSCSRTNAFCKKLMTELTN
ncbi:MAG: hypothetical protein MI867_04375 [Pseudomonadales bacterium]|nr:hypothetical protein [Pseudomonadales bacterium]